MRVDGIELEVFAGEQTGQGAAQVIEAKAETVHSGVDLQVIGKTLPITGGRALHRARRARRRDGWREPAIEQAVEIADAQRAEDENLRFHAGRAQRRAFLDVGTRQQIGAGLFQRPRPPDRRRGRRRWP